MIKEEEGRPASLHDRIVYRVEHSETRWGPYVHSKVADLDGPRFGPETDSSREGRDRPVPSRPIVEGKSVCLSIGDLRTWWEPYFDWLRERQGEFVVRGYLVRIGDTLQIEKGQAIVGRESIDRGHLLEWEVGDLIRNTIEEAPTFLRPVPSMDHMRDIAAELARAPKRSMKM